MNKPAFLENPELLNLREWVPNSDNIPTITRRLLWGSLAVGIPIALYQAKLFESDLSNKLAGLGGFLGIMASYLISPLQTAVDLVGTMDGGGLLARIDLAKRTFNRVENTVTSTITNFPRQRRTTYYTEQEYTHSQNP